MSENKDAGMWVHWIHQVHTEFKTFVELVTWVHWIRHSHQPLHLQGQGFHHHEEFSCTGGAAQFVLSSASHVAPHVGSAAAQQAGRGEKTKSCQTYYVPLFIYILAKRLICKCFWVLRFEFRVLTRLFCPVRLIPLFGLNSTAWVGIITHVHCASQRVLADSPAFFAALATSTISLNIPKISWKLLSIWLFVCPQIKQKDLPDFWLRWLFPPK